jgi:hypothetical protein
MSGQNMFKVLQKIHETGSGWGRMHPPAPPHAGAGAGRHHVSNGQQHHMTVCRSSIRIPIACSLYYAEFTKNGYDKILHFGRYAIQFRPIRTIDSKHWQEKKQLPVWFSHLGKWRISRGLWTPRPRLIQSRIGDA